MNNKKPVITKPTIFVTRQRFCVVPNLELTTIKTYEFLTQPEELRPKKLNFFGRLAASE